VTTAVAADANQPTLLVAGPAPDLASLVHRLRLATYIFLCFLQVLHPIWRLSGTLAVTTSPATGGSRCALPTTSQCHTVSNAMPLDYVVAYMNPCSGKPEADLSGCASAVVSIRWRVWHSLQWQPLRPACHLTAPYGEQQIECYFEV
jgi:hypothetical protein